MGLFDSLNTAKQAAAGGSKWAIGNFHKTKQINPRLTDKEIVNNLLVARYMRVSLESPATRSSQAPPRPWVNVNLAGTHYGTSR